MRAWLYFFFFNLLTSWDGVSANCDFQSCLSVLCSHWYQIQHLCVCTGAKIRVLVHNQYSQNMSYRSEYLQKAISSLYLSKIQWATFLHQRSSAVSVCWGVLWVSLGSLHWFLLLKRAIGLLAPVWSYNTVTPWNVMNGCWKNEPVFPRCSISTAVKAMFSSAPLNGSHT